MNNELKYEVYCPFCGEGLLFWGATGSMRKCPKCDNNLLGNKELWQALIQAKQDLEIATKALEKARINLAAIEPYLGDEYILDCKTDGLKEIDEALEQIEHKE